MKKPKTIGECARRLAAKMWADQALNCMASIVSIENTADGPHADVARELASEDFTVVVVAKGRAAVHLLAMLEPRSFHAEPDVTPP